MPGPCPNGRPTEHVHEKAKCRDKGRCTGPGCRVRRDKYVDPVLAGLAEDRAARATD